MGNVPFGTYHTIIKKWFASKYPNVPINRNARDKIIEMSYKKKLNLEEACEIYAKYLGL